MVLKSLSLIYQAIVQGRHNLYTSKVKATKKLQVPVVVVGNITTGGTGKTPFVNYTLKLMASQKLKAGVISRGYGGNYSGVANVDLQFSKGAIKFGDEPYLLKQKHPSTPIYLCGDRHKAGLSLLQANKDTKVIVCDDGFQHFALHRDFNIVLIDCTEDMANYKMLPQGRLREPMQGLERANFVIFTKSNWASPEKVKACQDLINDYFPLSEDNHAVAEYKSEYPVVNKNNVLVVSSIASPKVFIENIKKTNSYNIKSNLVFKDHHSYTEKDINNIIQEFNYTKCDHILTTEKDLVKLNQFDKVKDKLKTVNISVCLISGKESFERELFKIFS